MTDLLLLAILVVLVAKNPREAWFAWCLLSVARMAADGVRNPAHGVENVLLLGACVLVGLLASGPIGALLDRLNNRVHRV